jgi:hypothetical protein
MASIDIESERECWTNSRTPKKVQPERLPNPEWTEARAQLTEWQLTPASSVFEDTDIPVSDAAVEKALFLSLYLWDRSRPGPQFTSPDGCGGIAFEWRLGDGFTKLINVSPVGDIEEITLQSGREIARKSTASRQG